MHDFAEYLNDVRKEAILYNLIESCIATEEEKNEVEILVKKILNHLFTLIIY